MHREQQPSPTPITFEQVTRLAQEVLLRDGHHLPTLIIDGSMRPIIMQIDGLASTFEGRIQQMLIAGQALASNGSAGRLRSIYFVSEAWLSEAQDGRLPDMLPSQDPQRKEVLIVNGLEVQSKQMRLAIYEMLRDEHGNLREIRPMRQPGDSQASTDSPLLRAFLAGFQGLSSLR